MDLTSEIDSLGSLTSVFGAWALSPQDRSDSDQFNEYVFQFGPSSVVVTAIPDDDTIRLTPDGATLPFVEDLTGVRPWTELIGCEVVWMWRLINHRNYVDGCQFEFGRPGEIWTLQLMCTASELSVSSWSSFDGLQNQYRKYEPK
jgi:Family of unknown function (DUF6334)